MTDRLTCELVDEHDLLARFVAGRLAEEEVQALEEHCLGCDRCWSELRLALQVHAAAHAPEIIAAAAAAENAAGAPAFRRRLSLRLLAAAAILVLAAGAVWLGQRESPSEIDRGSLPLEPVNITLQDGKAVISWPSVEGASRYVVSVYARDGHPLASREVTANRAEFNESAIMAAGALATVEAYSALGDRISTSPPTPISPHSTP